MANDGKIVAIFDVNGMTESHYQQSDAALAAAGLSAPKGRIIHIASPTATGWHVVDVWESAADFEAFGQSLIPILQEIGVPPSEPTIYPLYNMILG